MKFPMVSVSDGKGRQPQKESYSIPVVKGLALEEHRKEFGVESGVNRKRVSGGWCMCVCQPPLPPSLQKLYSFKGSKETDW